MTYQPPGPVSPAGPSASAAEPPPAGPSTTGPPPAPDPPPSPYAKSEATRLLCAGVHLDPDLRRRVLSELVEHDERSVAPSLGFDLVTVLAHALRARRVEAATGAVLAAIWTGFAAVVYQPLIANAPSAGYWSSYLDRVRGDGYGHESGQDLLPDGLFELLGRYTTPYLANFAFLYALACLLSWYAKPAQVREDALYAPASPAGRGAPAADRRAPGGTLQVIATLVQLLYWLLALSALMRYSDAIGVVFPVALAATVWAHRLVVARTVRERLDRTAFEKLPPLRPPAGRRYQRIVHAVAAEQHSPLIVYDPAQPFLGAGFPYRPWSFVLELKRRTTGPVVAPAGELTGRAVLDLIVPRLLALRQATARTSLDRLREMEVQEVVFLPSGPPRSAVHREPQQVARHLREAVDEGGEPRRHYLRIRVGAWDEQVVLSVLLRVHTQGRLLVLEVVPHVLGPVRRQYGLLADAAALRGVRLRGGRPAMSAFTAGPAALRSLLRLGTGAGISGAPADDGVVAARPTVSLRELAGESTVSLFQELDVNRYLKTVQERIIAGVREALHNEGYETGRFEQTVVQVLNGGIHIGSMSGGAVASGAGASARHTTTAQPDEGGS
ncbi:hypothetical protein [Kitasatospora sp. NPDC097643]|uniref:hypothetical protein n=1 Tax=Kitasatospora sp. NPDC097643 TaxID=3157230 RepID=UPI00332ED66E